MNMTFEEELEMLRDVWTEARKLQKQLDLYLTILGRQIQRFDAEKEAEQRG